MKSFIVSTNKTAFQWGDWLLKYVSFRCHQSQTIQRIKDDMYYTLINWVGGQWRNILPAAFSVLTDRREVSAEKAKGNIFLHWPTNSVNKSFIALLTNPNNFNEKIDPTKQNSLAESSSELTFTLLVHGD